MAKIVDLPAIFLRLTTEEPCYVALSLSGHFPVAGQVDVTLFQSNCGAVQR